MINYEFYDLFHTDSVKKSWILTFSKKSENSSDDTNIITYPYSDSNKTVSGVTFTTDSTGKVTVNGQSTSDTGSVFNLIADSRNKKLAAGRYKITGCPKKGDNLKYFIRVAHQTPAYPTTGEIYALDIGPGYIFEVTPEHANENVIVQIIIKKMDEAVTNLEFNPKLVKLSDEYETVAVIQNDQILDGSLNLVESINSGDGLVFGRCESSKFEITICENHIPLKGCRLLVQVSLNDNDPFTIGTYKVDSDKPTADRVHRKITAYDSLYEINDKDVVFWYNGLTFPMTLKAFRDSFFTYLGVEQEETTLPNDNIQVEKKVDTESGVAGSAILSPICELNVSFGHIGRDNKFHYIRLTEMIEGLYPKDDLYPEDDLYPVAERVDHEVSKSDWMSMEYEDYTVKKIDGVVILNEEGKIAVTTNVDALNPLNIELNYLLYDKDENTLRTIANNIATLVTPIWYRPVNVKTTGNPCIEVGDSVRYNSRDCIVFTYVMSRTLTGIHRLEDTIEATGDETRSEDYNNVSKQLSRLSQRSEYDLEATNAYIRQLKTDYIDAALADIDLLHTHNLEVDSRISANELAITTKASVGSLDAVSARVGSLEADHVSVGSINALQATVNTINANYITASYITTEHILAALNAPGQGTITIGTVKCSSLQLLDGQSGTYRSITTITQNDSSGISRRFLIAL